MSEEKDEGLLGAPKRASARFYLDHIMYPVLENVAASHNMTVEAQVAEMIQKNDTLSKHLDNPRVVSKLEDVMGNPGVRFLLGRFKRYLNYSRDEVFEALPWWIERIGETRPPLYKVLSCMPEGSQWFGNVLHETLTIFKEYYRG